MPGESASVLFSIQCTTCKARLKVRDAAAVGQILSCPKCQSMVLVAPPAQWSADETAAAEPAELAAAAVAPVVDQETELSRGRWGAVLLGARWPVMLVGSLVGVAVGCGVWLLAEIVGGPAAAPSEPPVAARAAHSRVPRPAAEPPQEVDPAAPAAAEPTAGEGDEQAEAPSPAEQQPGDPAEPAVEPPPVPVAEPELPAASTPEPAPADGIDPSRRAAIEERLREPLAEVTFDGQPLGQYVEFLSQLAGVPIVLDEAALKPIRVGPRTRVNVRLKETTAGDALRAALGPLGAEYQVAAEGLRVVPAGPPER
jgi:hypothetical protein